MEPKTIKSISGKTIFKHSCIGYDIKTVLEIAIKSNVDLSGANLEGVDLSGAKLSFTILPLYCKWDVSYKSNGSIRIGLKENSIKNWDVFFESSEVFDTPRDTEDFKRIQANYNAVKAYMQTMGIG